jgi:transposase InsO family protein/site-specific recombinase XerD
MKVYYENVLSNQNYSAKPNIAWVADITKFDLNQGKKVYVFFCLDIFSNRILASLFRTKPITTLDIVKKLTEVIEKRIPIKPRREVIIHTDRGTEFSSQKYNQFIKKQEGFVVASMSRPNTPKDNPVAERFMRTFKEHKVNDRTFQKELFYQIEINSKFKGYRKVFNLFVKDINFKPNSKSGNKSPEQYDVDASTASMLMIEPTYSKAFSEFYGEDFRREPVDEFKMQNNNIVSILDEITAKQAEVVNKTPFDFYEDNLALKVIDERLKEVQGLLQRNPDITRQYVEEAILPIQDMLESMDDKLNILLPKKRRERQTLQLRDPVYTELFDVFLAAAGSTSKYKQDLKCAQLKIAYTILFYVGLRVNEIRFFQEKDIQDAIKTSQFSVVHFKQREPYIHVISDLAVKELKRLKHQYHIVFVKYKYEYLFGKNKPIDDKHLIKTMNQDLKHTCEINQIPYNIKSHSFRINMISQLLKNTSVQNAADIIGHRDIKSTMAYKRYALNKKEIQKLLNKIDQDP